MRPDFDGLEIAVAPDEGNVYIFHFPGTAVGEMPWPMFHHDARRTGRYSGGY